MLAQNPDGPALDTKDARSTAAVRPGNSYLGLATDSEAASSHCRGDFWYPVSDSNARPLAPQASALSTELTGHTCLCP